ncbi:MAG: hypothetical protein M1485_02260 [Chloroflexi bacterium]|nr:hypothetical protein [Chloroflexota bacterium]
MHRSPVAHRKADVLPQTQAPCQLKEIRVIVRQKDGGIGLHAERNAHPMPDLNLLD